MNGTERIENPPDASDDGQISGGARRQVTVIDNRLESRDLFIGTRDILIGHGAEAYRLRLTAQNKLILTK